MLVRVPACVLLVLVAAIAIAQAEPHRAAPWRGSVGVGGHLSLTGPTDYGPVAIGTFWPGGRLGRYGLRLEGRGLDETNADSGMVTAGVIYQAAAARPRLALSLHGEAGATFPDHLPVLGGGVEVVLWAIGPLGVGLDSTAHILFEGIDSQLVLGSALTVRIAR